MRRPMGRFFNRAALARGVGYALAMAAIAAATIYLAAHQPHPGRTRVSSSSSIPIKDDVW